jgi:hypothetical protein
MAIVLADYEPIPIRLATAKFTIVENHGKSGIAFPRSDSIFVSTDKISNPSHQTLRL